MKTRNHLPTFDKTVTIFNRLKGIDSTDGLDKWTKTVVQGCSWKAQADRKTQGNDRQYTTSAVVKVPKNGLYREYSEWKKSQQGFTFSVGDVVVLGEVAEDIASESVRDIIQQHKPNAITVNLFSDFTYDSLDGVAQHYRIEGNGGI